LEEKTGTSSESEDTDDEALNIFDQLLGRRPEGARQNLVESVNSNEDSNDDSISSEGETDSDDSCEGSEGPGEEEHDSQIPKKMKLRKEDSGSESGRTSAAEKT
jgi:hypothetical protein